MSKQVATRCPKCKGKSFTLYERLEVAHAFRVQDGEALVCEIADGLPTTIGFSARCDCGNYWVPRDKTAGNIIAASEWDGSGYPAAAPTPPSGVETIRQDNTSGGL